MKSVRLGTELEKQLEHAAQAARMSQSEFIRDAITRRCDEVLGPTLADRLQPVIGVIESNGGRADDTGAAFGKLLQKKRKR